MPRMLHLKIPLIAILLVCLMGVQVPLLAQDEIEWVDITQGVEAAKDQQKIMLINIYTNWCGFCKRLDQTTFLDDEVRAMIEGSFIPIKFNAEMKESAVFMGTTYTYIKEGRRGHHGLAAHLLDQRLGYPTLVYVLPNGEIIHRSPGFRNEVDMLKELTFIKEGHYKTVDWRTYKRSK